MSCCNRAAEVPSATGTVSAVAAKASAIWSCVIVLENPTKACLHEFPDGFVTPGSPCAGLAPRWSKIVNPTNPEKPDFFFAAAERRFCTGRPGAPACRRRLRHHACDGKFRPPFRRVSHQKNPESRLSPLQSGAVSFGRQGHHPGIGQTSPTKQDRAGPRRACRAAIRQRRPEHRGVWQGSDDSRQVSGQLSQSGGRKNPRTNLRQQQSCGNGCGHDLAPDPGLVPRPPEFDADLKLSLHGRQTSGRPATRTVKKPAGAGLFCKICATAARSSLS